MLRPLVLAPITRYFATFALAECPSCNSQNEKTAERLLRTPEGLRYPGSESGSTRISVFHGGSATLPTAAALQQVSGCPAAEQGITYRLDFDDAPDRLDTVQP